MTAYRCTKCKRTGSCLIVVTGDDEYEPDLPTACPYEMEGGPEWVEA